MTWSVRGTGGAARVGWLPLVGLVTLAARAAPGDAFAACEAQLASAPEARASAACFATAARPGGQWPAAARRLAAHVERAPDNPWLHYYLGNVEWPGRVPSAAQRYRRAAELLEARREPAAATDAWLNRAAFLRLSGRHLQAAAALERALRSAQLSGEAPVIAKVEIEQARQAIDSGRELARSYRRLRRIEANLAPGSGYALWRDVWQGLAVATYNLGRWDEARAYRRRLLELARVQGDRYLEVSALYGLAVVELAARPHAGSRDERVALLHSVLQAAREAGHRSLEAQAERVLGRLASGEQGRVHLTRCAAIARELQQPEQLSECLRALAVSWAAEDPTRARALLDEALELALRSESPLPLVYGWLERLRVSWATLGREAALVESLATLESIEALRARQYSETGRLGVGAVWSEAYLWLSGRLLEGTPTAREQALAFNLAERGRARALLDDIGEDPGAVDPQRHELTTAIAALQRRLLEPGLEALERRGLLERLDRLENDEAERREAATGQPGAGEPAVELAAVQALLSPREALLAFQVALRQDAYGDFGGGAWLLAITRSAVRLHALPDRRELEPAVAMLQALLARRDGSERAASAVLHERLLGPALRALPATIDELVIVPDGALHAVPFAALAGADGLPLALRYRLGHAPSATLWARWRRRVPAPVPAAAVVFADPPSAGGSRPAAQRAAWLYGEAGPGALPEARREARGIARLLGPACRLHLGDEASEALLKGGVGRAPLLHLASHALVDGGRPERSAVLLAPGGDREDGLLQPREIAALALDDRVVVLSACRGAAGSVLQGEGVMSLARAFFRAGARSVVAGLWPVRDDEMRALMERFYRRLAAGEPLAAALAAAQRERAAAGRPAADWAGVLVLGDGAWAPFQPPAPTPFPWRVAWAAGAVLAALCAFMAWRRLRARSAPQP